MSSESFNLSWSDFTSSASESFRKLLTDTNFADVTLVCDDDQQINAHKVILGSSSQFFQRILVKNPHQHPLIYLTGIQHAQLKSILNFIYLGETEVGKDDLDSFIKTAKKLEIEGLMDHSGEDQNKEVLPKDNPSMPQTEVQVKNEPISNQDDILEELDRSNNIDKEMYKSKLEENQHIEQIPNLRAKTSLNPQINIKFIEDNVDEQKYDENFDNTKRTVTSATEQQKIQCKHCDKSFTQSGTLNRHVKTLHDGVRYRCTSCGYSSTSPQYLKQHSAKMHSGN